jgi:hypothetical protein
MCDDDGEPGPVVEPRAASEKAGEPGLGHGVAVRVSPWMTRALRRTVVGRRRDGRIYAGQHDADGDRQSGGCGRDAPGTWSSPSRDLVVLGGIVEVLVRMTVPYGC